MFISLSTINTCIRTSQWSKIGHCFVWGKTILQVTENPNKNGLNKEGCFID